MKLWAQVGRPRAMAHPQAQHGGLAPFASHGELQQMMHARGPCTALQGYRLVAGTDEAGRGPLAGPVVAAACCIPEDVVIEGVADRCAHLHTRLEPVPALRPPSPAHVPPSHGR